ncbi:MAG: hypothetical protein LBC78_05045 [Oscillospiraceae bacterium]|nr:hypothetical protein [Oscillospiraceae bacterium]
MAKGAADAEIEERRPIRFGELRYIENLRLETSTGRPIRIMVEDELYSERNDGAEEKAERGS